MSIGPAVHRPRDLPEFRIWLNSQWEEGALFWQVAQATRKDRRLPGQEWVHLEAIFDSRALPDAELYWVSSEMCQLIALAAKTLPSTTLTKELVPAESGLVWFEEPLIGMTSREIEEAGRDTDTIPVRALLWGEALIPPGPHPAMGIASYGEYTIIAPAGRTDWEWGADSEEPIDEAIIDDQRMLESMSEDRRWMATFWLLLSQRGVADTSMIRAQPREIRKGKRKLPGLTTKHFDVRVVDVHQHQRVATESTGTGRAVDWSHRWIVNPFWRQQAYGPGRSLRRPTLIGPYIKGPRDLPLVVKETVHLLRDGDIPQHE